MLAKLVEYLPKGERYFPKEQFTDQPERFLVAELIRERILDGDRGRGPLRLRGGGGDDFEEPEPVTHSKKLPLTRISAVIYCERDRVRKQSSLVKAEAS